ncbi:MAG: FKBP-type peptidyl-prolyl cis-trans isomerase [Balneolaceae bacterium]|nr:FKBP-type peptidyl-prolyl cis-trans isomerase [Balneolaceae bacterium]MBO6546602.1 FKBP-type peptidyl-prolyl cis-trans isomerase [Balneolaceae bacterium]MBO6648960.1 FKBP-type peptidyl-prolyl cis-trans isomerase [Balneolaceae bacterium]
MNSFKNLKFFSLILLTGIILSACDDDSNPFRIDYSDVPPLPDTTAQNVTKVTTESGLIYYVITEGNPESFEVVIRDDIQIYYTGRTQDGDIFESSYGNGSTTPDRFNDIGSYANGRGTNSKGEGFVEGILGMLEGERRVLVIPSNLNTTESSIIVYDIELETIEY